MRKRRKTMKKKMNIKRAVALTLAGTVALTGLGFTGCSATGGGDEQVIIYSNADEEAITAMENALDSNGYEGQYMFQTFGTSELGGSLSLDLYDQWKTMEVDGKWRFTSPTHVVLAFAQAMKELEEEGGIEARSRRYRENNRLLIEKMGELGIHPYIDSTHQGPIITTFFYPEKCHFTFSQMYEYIKERGYAIYPGKVTEAETFRIGNIGEIYPEDIEKVCELMKNFLEEYNHEEN